MGRREASGANVVVDVIVAHSFARAAARCADAASATRKSDPLGAPAGAVSENPRPAAAAAAAPDNGTPGNDIPPDNDTPDAPPAGAVIAAPFASVVDAGKVVVAPVVGTAPVAPADDAPPFGAALAFAASAAACA